MANDNATADDVEQVSSTVAPGQQPTAQFPPSERPNAFAELMKPKKKQLSDTADADAPSKRTIFAGRDGLAAYTVDPESFPASRVVYYNDKFTVINDLFPKSQIHMLILPRDPNMNVLRPQEAFDDPKFLQDCIEEEKRVREMVAEELRRKFGKSSSTEQARIQAMQADDPSDVLPPGRDWIKSVKSGIHANPSMSHLHIHVLSVDHVSDSMKKKNHYLSFTTDFFVSLDQFPLPLDDYRRDYKHFPEDMLCWRCGKNFENRITRLKEHLAEEFEAWKKE